MNVAAVARVNNFLNAKFKNKTEERFLSVVEEVNRASGIDIPAEGRTQQDALKAFYQNVNFRDILLDSMNNILIEKWSASPESWRIWVNNYELNDFRENYLSTVGVLNEPKLVPPGAEYTESGVSDGERVPAKLNTFGSILNFDRHYLVNDDIGAVNRLISTVSQAHDRDIGNRVYKFLTDNPVSFGDAPLFHTDHNNIVTKTADFQADLISAINRMSNIEVTFQNADNEELQIIPKYIIVPSKYMFTAANVVEKYNNSVTESQRLVVVMEPRLANYDGWFLAADNSYPTIGLMTLTSVMRPVIYSTNNFTYDGLKIKHTMDKDVRPLDYKGLIRVA